ncbi:GNAT family N-acetyltransferase [Rhizobium sp. LjRoot258]|uniref:GNAT family N-acetyltransferase n=1 Tax=Rhizobium sp. LjRoot258 TaxID=3342299 RepID=UPI003ECCF7CA
MTDGASDTEDDDSYLAFETRFRKHSDEPDILDWSVELRRYPASNDEPGPPLARLKGFLAQPGYLPEEDDDWYFAVFDMRSEHAVQALEILTANTTLIKKGLKRPMSFDECGAVAHLERMWVDPSLRGKGVGIRLMREAKHVLGRYGLLVILKAHLDGDDVSGADNLKLAAYYQSDKSLGLVPVSKKKRPGWLVGVWDEPVAHPDDSLFFYEDD